MQTKSLGSDAKTRCRYSGLAAACAIGSLVFVINSISILSAWLDPPAGYVAGFVARNGDAAQYETWLRALQTRWLLPNFHAPWITEPGLFQGVLLLISRSASALGADVRHAMLVFGWLVHILTAYSVIFALRSFTRSRLETWWAVVFMLGSLPIQSLDIFPRLLASGGKMLVPSAAKSFHWISSDGFFHGISGSPLQTLATGLTILALSCVARWIRHGEQRWIRWAAGLTFVLALVHPFELPIVAGAGGLGILLWRWPDWRAAVPGLGLLATAAVLGLTPHVASTLAVPWVAEAAAHNRWIAPPPLAWVLGLGLPTILCLLLLGARFVARSFDARGWEEAEPEDRILEFWVGIVLVGVYLPFLPWTQHLIDGFHCAIGLLLARLVAKSSWLTMQRQRWPRVARVLVLSWLLVSLGTLAVYVRQAAIDGRRAQSTTFANGLTPVGEVDAVAWLRANADENQLVMAPWRDADWYAAVPMHSFASHDLFSLGLDVQRAASQRFFEGTLDEADAGRLIAHYGIRYVVTPAAGPALRYLGAAQLRHDNASLAIYEFPASEMKPYERGSQNW